jgi:hypothetical protein
LADRSKVELEVAELAGRGCAPHCTVDRLKISALKSRLTALDQESREVRAQKSRLESYQQVKERAHRDPALWALSVWFSWPPDILELALGVLVGTLLDGVGCTCWALLLFGRSVDETKVTAVPRKATVMEEQAVAVTLSVGNAALHPSHKDEEQRLAALLANARAAVESGHLRNTVRAIREYFKCSQNTAMLVGRMLKAVTSRD